ncbi:outer membrane lipid asymmetry maintenance protein MlaD [Novosphingobium umbonatum]|nr:outer membrane lipid asymmetry maintenance protein MlaD [Novosphingobium umbonatum]
MRGNWGETILGLAVLAFAGIFLAYALGVTGMGKQGATYELTARFGEAGGIQPGAKVTVSGVKVGDVREVTIDPKTFLAVMRLTLDDKVKLPSDSTAKITSDGLLGGAHIAIAPGGAADDLKPGGEIANTQGAVDLFGLIGQVMRPKSDAPAEKPAPAASPSAAPKGTADLPEM